MISQLAIDDINDLHAAGLRLTPAEIIRLNALALRCDRSPTAAAVNAAPRIGWAGPVPIHEPTLASENWVSTVAETHFLADEYDSAVLFACAHAPVPGFFTRPGMTDPDAVRRLMLQWASTLPVTQDQLKAALAFALTGNDPSSGERPEPPPSNSDTDQTPSVPDTLTAIADEALAAGLGLPLAELTSLTPSRLVNILNQHYRNQGLISDKADLRAHADYARTFTAVRAAALARANKDTPNG